MTTKSTPKSQAPLFDLSKAPPLAELTHAVFEGSKRATDVHVKASQEQHQATASFLQDLSHIKPSLSFDAWEEGYRKTLSYVEGTQARTRKWFEELSDVNTATGKQLKDLIQAPSAH